MPTFRKSRSQRCCLRRASISEKKSRSVSWHLLRLWRALKAGQRAKNRPLRILACLKAALTDNIGPCSVDRNDNSGGMTMKKIAFILVAALATLFNTALRADDYPSRPVTMVAVFGPGSGSDTICRIIANK